MRMNRDQQTSLYHELQQAYGLHRNRFTSGIGSGNHQNPVFIVQFDIDRNGRFLGFLMIQI